ncbi:MAG: DUF2490 domain-containing protein [Prolixibacteraceae bacterium]|jgi:long-subunit fatty acid transport protein
MRTKSLLLLLLLISGFSGFAQSTWFEMEFSKKIFKNLKIEFNPELRMFSGFEMDSYILEGGLSYKLHKYLTLAGYYRYENEYNYREKREIYEWEPADRFAFDAKSGVQLSRFDVQFRLRYTNGTDFDDTTDDHASFFRYRAKIEYDIKGNKLAPFASIEAFHDLISENIDKMRYTGGLAYPINKKNELSLFYRLQDYSETDKESMNIIGIGYSLKF